MIFAEALQGVRKLFLDTAPVIYFVERHPRYLPILRPIFSQLDSGTLQAVTSAVTLSECLVLPYRQPANDLSRLFIQLIVEQSQFVAIGQVVALSAAQLRADYNLNLPDAFQLAVALASQCDAFLTNDLTLKRITALRILVLDEIERPTITS